MPRPRPGDPMYGGFADELFSRIERLEAHVELIEETIAELKGKLVVVGSDYWKPVTYGPAVAATRKMTLTELKYMLEGKEEGPIELAPSLQPTPEASGAKIESPHAAHKSSFILKI